MTITVYDDKIVSPFCDTCAGDYVEVWFDVNPPEPESDSTEKPAPTKPNKKELQFKKRSDKGIYCFKVYPGNFYENRAYVREVSTTDKLYKFQKEAASLIKASSSIQSEQSRYIIKFKVPFMIFGYDGPPVEEKKITEFGCTVVLHDIDNPYRPEEETQIATSAFDSSDPATYGSIKLIPPEMWYGEMVNIFTADVLKYIVDLGF
jgi:hypothetical protein